MTLLYNQNLKFNSRILRCNLTIAEALLWSRVRRKQICNIQFYRQKPIGNYIVDFYAPRVSLIVELDGSQHYEYDHMQRDKERDAFLTSLGLKVLRFDNIQVVHSIENVLEVILSEAKERKSPPALCAAPFVKGGKIGYFYFFPLINNTSVFSRLLLGIEYVIFSASKLFRSCESKEVGIGNTFIFLGLLRLNCKCQRLW